MEVRKPAMKVLVVLMTITVLAFGGISVASAAPASGTTTLQGVAHSDQPVSVLVSIVSDAPVVPYEFSVLNECWFSGRYAGHYDSYERFDLIGPWFAGPGGSAQTTVNVNLQPVPAGTVCKVSIVRNNTTVKGSPTSYTVVA
jgi:hypothetical protein